VEKRKELVIVGDSLFAQIAYEYFTHDSEYTVVAFSVERGYINKSSLFGLPVIPLDEIRSKYPPSEFTAFVAITYIEGNKVRARIYNQLKEWKYLLATYVSSKAFVWRNVKIGDNCFIFEDNTVQPWVSIGNDVIIWSGNHLGHHSEIQDHVFISSHVVISGFCKIGKFAFLGVNSTISNNVSIGEGDIIGAGAVVIGDTENNTTYVGNPARPISRK